MKLAVDDLDWTYAQMGEHGEHVIFTGVEGAANNELIEVIIAAHHYEISSSSLGEVWLSDDENRRNAELLNQKIQEFLAGESAEKLKLEATWLDDLNANPAEYNRTQKWIAFLKDSLLFRTGGVVTLTIIIANILVFGAMAVSGAGFFDLDAEALVRWGGNYSVLTLGGDYWRLLSNTFLHGGVMHLVFNVYGLIVGGFLAESLLGKKRYAIAYLVSGFTASVLSVYMHEEVLSVGASGAIFGCFGIVMGLASTSLLQKSERSRILISFGIFVGLSLISGMKDNTDNWAHIGGLGAGWLMGVLWSPFLSRKELVRRRKIADTAIPATIAIAALLLLISKPNSIAELQTILERFDAKTEQAVSFYPEGDYPDSASLAVLRDSGTYYLESGREVLKKAYLIKGLSEDRRRYIDLVVRLNDARIKAFRYTYLMHMNPDRAAYRDSFQRASMQFSELHHEMTGMDPK